MRALYFFLALGCGAAWVSCGGSGTDNLFAGSGGMSGGGGEVTGGSGQPITGGSGSVVGAAGASGGGMVGKAGAGGGGGPGTAGQGGNPQGAGGAVGVAGKGGSAGMAGSATAGMGGAGTMVVVIDAGRDAPSVVDAGPSPRIRCGTRNCNPNNEFCCLDDPPVCVPLGSDACRNRDRLHCDDTSDCDANQLCCVIDNNNGNPIDAVCRGDCPNLIGGRRAQILCANSEQCPNNASMCSSTFQDILASYDHCH